MKKTIVWIAALVVGAILGLLGLHWLDQTMEFVAVVYRAQGSGKIFGRTLTYTLLTTFAAAAVGAVLYVLAAPGNLPAEAIGQGIYSKIPCLWYANNMPEVLWEWKKRRTFAL